MNSHHKKLLSLIRERSGKATQHTFQDNYLGNSHPRYPISVPVLRNVVRDWSKSQEPLDVAEFEDLLTSLISGKSSTEKSAAGLLLNYAGAHQRKFNPVVFDTWLDHLVGWAEVDVLCTGKYSSLEVSQNLKAWKKILTGFSKSKNIHKRRASLVTLCSPLSKEPNEPLAEIAFANIETLKHEKEILITKAISWLLRTMIKHHRGMVIDYLDENGTALPAIAVRETLMKLKTGKKTKKKPPGK